MRLYVVDASVALKWYIPEILSDRALIYLAELHQGQAAFLAPDLILPELGNVLWKKHRQHELSIEEVRMITETLALHFPVNLVESKELLPAAMELAVISGLTLYDSLYLALAAVKDAILLTADQRIAQAGRNVAYVELLK